MEIEDQMEVKGRIRRGINLRLREHQFDKAQNGNKIIEKEEKQDSV